MIRERMENFYKLVIKIQTSQNDQYMFEKVLNIIIH